MSICLHIIQYLSQVIANKLVHDKTLSDIKHELNNVVLPILMLFM